MPRGLRNERKAGKQDVEQGVELHLCEAARSGRGIWWQEHTRMGGAGSTFGALDGEWMWTASLHSPAKIRLRGILETNSVRGVSSSSGTTRGNNAIPRGPLERGPVDYLTATTGPIAVGSNGTY